MLSSSYINYLEGFAHTISIQCLFFSEFIPYYSIKPFVMVFGYSVFSHLTLYVFRILLYNSIGKFSIINAKYCLLQNVCFGGNLTKWQRMLNALALNETFYRFWVEIQYSNDPTRFKRQFFVETLYILYL